RAGPCPPSRSLPWHAAQCSLYRTSILMPCAAPAEHDTRRLNRNAAARGMMRSSEGCDREALGAWGHTDFLVREIAGRILGPGIAGDLHRANARIAATDVEMAALPAAALD